MTQGWKGGSQRDTKADDGRKQGGGGMGKLKKTRETVIMERRTGRKPRKNVARETAKKLGRLLRSKNVKREGKEEDPD